MDNFKNINDSYGHLVGDALLQEVASRLTNLHPNHFIARLGGDEFAIVVEPSVDVEMFAQQTIKVFCEPIFLSGKELIVTSSIGISIYPDDGNDELQLIQYADKAMYEAKRKGKNQFFRYNKGLEQ